MSGGDFIGNLITIGNGGASGGGMTPHLIGGPDHLADTKANLQTKINDVGFLFLLSNLAAEINALPFKSTNSGRPQAADEMTIENSTALWAKEKISLSMIASALWQTGFEAWRNTSQALPDNSETIVQLNSVNNDFEGTYSTGTYTFTPLTLGRYILNGSITVAMAAAGNLQIRMKQAGVIQQRASLYCPAAGNYTVSISRVMRLAPSGPAETINIYAFQVSGFAASLVAGQCFLTGGQISRV